MLFFVVAWCGLLSLVVLAVLVVDFLLVFPGLLFLLLVDIPGGGLANRAKKVHVDTFTFHGLLCTDTLRKHLYN